MRERGCAQFEGVLRCVLAPCGLEGACESVVSDLGSNTGFAALEIGAGSRWLSRVHWMDGVNCVSGLGVACDGPDECSTPAGMRTGGSLGPLGKIPLDGSSAGLSLLAT